MRSALAGVVRGHPLVAFFVLAYALAWWAWPLYAWYGFPVPFFPSGPLLAALVVVAVTAGRPGLRALGARMLRWRVGRRWYAVVLGLRYAPRGHRGARGRARRGQRGGAVRPHPRSGGAVAVLRRVHDLGLTLLAVQIVPPEPDRRLRVVLRSSAKMRRARVRVVGWAPSPAVPAAPGGGGAR